MTEPLKPAPTHTIREFEGLRGLLAIMVLVGHWATTIPQSLAPLPQNLWAVEAVNVFIILSGFVITALLTRGGESYRQYITRRWFRLWPTFVVILALCTVLLPLTEQVLRAAPPSTMQEERMRMLADANENLGAHLISHATMLHGIAPRAVDGFAPYTIVGQGWSISLEWQFYLLAPFFFLCLKRRGWRYKLALLSLAAALVLSGRYFTPAYLGNKLGFFALGYLSFQAHHAWRIHSGRFSLTQARAAALSLILAALMLRGQFGIAVAGWLAMFLTMLLASRPGATPERLLNRLWLLPPMQFLGSISYTLYLVHFQMLVLALWLVNPTHLGHWPTNILFLILTLIFSILGAAILSRFVERPGMRWGKRLASKLK